MADAEHGLERVIRRWLEVGELGHDRLDGVARHGPRDEEVHRERYPGRHGVEAQPAQDKGHRQAPISRRPAARGGGPVTRRGNRTPMWSWWCWQPTATTGWHWPRRSPPRWPPPWP